MTEPTGGAVDFNRAPSVSDDFDALLAASSLGAPRVRAVRAHTPRGIRDLLGARLENRATQTVPLPATDVVGAVREACTHRAPDAWLGHHESGGHLPSGPPIPVEALASAVAGWLLPRARHELVVIPAGWRTLTGIWRQAAGSAAPELHPLPFPDLYGGLAPWLRPPGGRRQRCRWCARAQAPGLGFGDLLSLRGLPSYPDLLCGWTMLEGVPTGLDHALFHAPRNFGRPVPVQSGVCLAWRFPMPPQTTVLGSGVLPVAGGPRRTLLVVAQGTQALWHLLPRRDLAHLRPEPAPGTGMDAGLSADEQRAPLACTVDTERGVTTVRAHTQLQLLVGDPPRPRLLPATFTYRSDDPYAVRVVFGERRGAQVEWVFARELLIEGLRSSSGTGDVRVHREADVPGQAGPARVHISLSSPEGRAQLAMLASDLETFLAKTRAVVVYGSEHQHMCVPWETLTEELWWHPNPHR